jgi:hypothetical protein
MRLELVLILPTALVSILETSMDISGQSLGFIGFMNDGFRYRVGFHGFVCWDEFLWADNGLWDCLLEVSGGGGRDCGRGFSIEGWRLVRLRGTRCSSRCCHVRVTQIHKGLSLESILSCELRRRVARTSYLIVWKVPREHEDHAQRSSLDF